MTALLEMPENLIDIPKPKIIHHGIRLEICIFVSDKKGKSIDFEVIISNAVNDGELVKIIQNQWKLNSSTNNDLYDAKTPPVIILVSV